MVAFATVATANFEPCVSIVRVYLGGRFRCKIIVRTIRLLGPGLGYTVKRGEIDVRGEIDGY